MSGKLNVAIVGLEFGKEFIPIYRLYPHTNMYAICQRNREKLDRTGEEFGVEVRYQDYAELLRDPKVDIVHINTPLQMHADQVVMGLEAGKHVACTIPMAIAVEDCRRIVEAVEKTGMTYMMMETVVYAREYLYVKELYERGDLGKIQFIRASHQQEMWGWPDYWHGMPPMHNATHAISPCLSIGGWEAEYVSCFGSGRVQDSMIPKYGCPYAIESTHIKFKDSDVAAEVTRSLFNTARQYREHFDVYGSKQTFEWTLIEHEDHILHTGETPKRIRIPDFADRLPREIRVFTTGGVYNVGENGHRSFTQGGGHGGSHPHLVHEFISSIREGRDPYPNARQAANITCSGILSHQSAMEGGKHIRLPEWTFSKGKPLLSRVAAGSVEIGGNGRVAGGARAEALGGKPPRVLS
ncbi:MAG: oxidoreductase domain protein [Fibrobacteres bacterium]|nr:oxidoreductase domain protein [Fibrobacterota bacterium]